MLRKLCLVLSLSWIALTPGHAQVVTVTPSTQTVSVGDPFTVNLQISGLGAGTAPSVGVYDIDLGFDPNLVSFSSVAFGSGLDVLGLGSVQLTTVGPGVINLFELSLDTANDLNALQAGAFTLASISFSAWNPGTSLFSLSLNSLGDADGAALSASLQGSSVTAIASSVPEPESWAMVVIALCTFGIALRRSKRNNFGA